MTNASEAVGEGPPQERAEAIRGAMQRIGLPAGPVAAVLVYLLLPTSYVGV
jgi:hypothetical protein